MLLKEIKKEKAFIGHNNMNTLPKYIFQIQHNFGHVGRRNMSRSCKPDVKWRENFDSLEPNTMVIIKDDKVPQDPWGESSAPSAAKTAYSVWWISGRHATPFSKICLLFRKVETKQ